MTSPLQVGLVGAGPWAAKRHAPVLAAGPETELAGVWARRPEAAHELAAAHGTRAFASFEELLDGCEAVAFAVAPAAQGPLAARAARAGKAVLLEKPIASDLDGAARLAAAVGEAGVGSLVVLSARFSPEVRSFLEQASGWSATGARLWTLTNAFLTGPYAASPWRQDRGVLLDVGPHAIDLVSAALGPITDLHARRSPGDVVVLSLAHASGAVSAITVCCRSAVDQPSYGIEVIGARGTLGLNVGRAIGPATWATLRSEFATVARSGAAHACDVGRGLELQGWLDHAEGQLG